MLILARIIEVCITLYLRFLGVYLGGYLYSDWDYIEFYVREYEMFDQLYTYLDSGWMMEQAIESVV